MTADALEPMNPEDPMVRSGARWCGVHGHWECTAKVNREHHAPAIRGMSKCRFHVGKELDLAKTQGEANLAVWQAAAGRDLPPVKSAAAVMEQLRLVSLRADVVGELLRLQVADEEVGGLIGKTYAAGRDGSRVETGEASRGLVKYELELRDRIVKYAEAAHRMKIDDQQIELAQGQASIVTGALRAMFESAGAEVLPAVRAAMVAVFLERLGAPVELEGGGDV